MAEEGSEPEADRLAEGEAQLQAEGLCDAERVAHWLAVRLCVSLLLRVREARADAVLRWPSAAAPPVALGLPELLSLLDAECAGEAEAEPEDERLALGAPDCVAHWVSVRLALPLPLWEAEGVAEAVPWRPSAAAPLVALAQTLVLALKDTARVEGAEVEPENEMLAQEVPDRVAHWLAEGLAVPLPLREAEGAAEAVPRKRLKAAPPVALAQSVALPLWDTECVGVAEPELEEEWLAHKEKELLTEGQGEGVCVAQCVALLLKVPLPLRVPEEQAEAVPR